MLAYIPSLAVIVEKIYFGDTSSSKKKQTYLWKQYFKLGSQRNAQIKHNLETKQF